MTPQFADRNVSTGAEVFICRAMAAPAYPGQQAFPPPQPYQKYTEGGYQPAPAQFQSQPAAGYPSQGQPPSYDYGGQPGYQPMPAPPPVTACNTTVVVASQPSAVTTTYQPPPEEDHSGMAVCALVFSIITLIFCGTSLVCLTCTIPALILAVVALGARGSAQKSNAGISIALNAVVVVSTVLFLVVFIPVYVVFGRVTTCSSYYDYTYSSYCIPYAYSSYVCTYYASSGYCPYTR